MFRKLLLGLVFCLIPVITHGQSNFAPAQTYAGTAAEMPPCGSQGINPGDEYHQTDTGNTFTCNNAKTWGGASGQFSAPGVFTNTAGVNGNFSAIVNGLSPATEWSGIGQPGADTEAWTAGIALPATATAHQGTAGAFYATTAVNGNGGAGPNAVGVYAQCRTLATGGACWGINPIVSDDGFAAGLLANEFDSNLSSTSSGGANSGSIVITGGSTAQPTQSLTTAGNYPAIRILPLGSTGEKFTSGLAIGDASSSNGNTSFGDAIDIGTAFTINPSASLGIVFHTRNSSGTRASTYFGMQLDANGLAEPIALEGSTGHGAYVPVMPVNGFSYTGLSPQNFLTYTTCTLSSGTCTHTFSAAAYPAAPVCSATWNGTGTLTGILKAVPSTTTVVVTSSVGTDSAVVQIVCGPAGIN